MHFTFLLRSTLVATAIAVCAASAPASATTFEGRCAGAGPVSVSPPLGPLPAATTLDARYRGTCTGMLDGRRVVDIPFRSRARATGPLSCAGGAVSGGGRIVLGRKRRVALVATLENLNLGPDAAFSLHGAEGGLGTGRHTMAPDTPLLGQCLATDIESVSITVSWATVTPMRG